MAWNLNLSGYLALLVIEIKSQLVYAFDFIASFIAKLVRPLIMLAVWAAVFLNTKATSIGGFTLTVTTSYFFLMAFMSILIDEDIEEMIQGDVQSGGIASALIKPLHYPFKALSGSLGSYIVFLVAVGLPIFLIMLTFAPLHLTALSLTLFAVEVAVALVIFNVIGFLIGTLALYFTSVTSIANTVFSIAAMLAGLTIPLNFLPRYILSALELTPFPILGYIPVTTLLGTTGASEAIFSISVSAVWALALLVFAYFWWKRVVRNLSSVGG